MSVFFQKVKMFTVIFTEKSLYVIGKHTRNFCYYVYHQLLNESGPFHYLDQMLSSFTFNLIDIIHLRHVVFMMS